MSQIGATILGSQLNLTNPGTPVIGDIMIRATHADGLFGEMDTILGGVLGVHTTGSDSGGPQLTYNADPLTADSNCTHGKTFSNKSARVSSLYQSERSADPPVFRYDFPVSNGEYEVHLHFAEIYWGASRGGPFEGLTTGLSHDCIGSEGITLLDDYDINADVGPQTEVIKTFTVTVADGEP